MNVKNNRWHWLGTLENAVPVSGYGNRLSMYLIALEAWRRGIQVKFYYLDNQENKMLIRYSLRYNDKEHLFESSMGDKLSRKAFNICENKDKTKKYLKITGIPVPEGKRFREDEEDEEILSYAKLLGYPVVLKPVSGNAGLGVFANIKSEQTLKKYIEHVRYELGLKDIIIERYIPGIEYRILLVDGKIIGAVNRIPANVVGNGKSTIKELIDQKNRIRKRNPNLSSKSIIIDKEVKDMINQLGFHLNSIPEKGKRVFLRNKSNVSIGGDPIDVTDKLTPELREIAINAMKSIPGLNVCGLDMIVDPNTNTGTVIEINTKPMIGLHVFPVQGKSRDVAKAIVDYYFPETIGKSTSNLYFDFDAAIAPIRSRISNYTILLPPPLTDKMATRKMCVHVNSKKNIDFAAKIRLEALKREFHGYIKEINNDIYEIVLASSDEASINNFKDRCLFKVKDIEITNINETKWTKPVKIGFEIKRLSKTKRKTNRKLRRNLRKLQIENKNLKEKTLLLENRLDRISSKFNKQKIKNKRLNEKMLLLINEINDIRKKHNEIMNSRSWRYTKLFRQISKKLRSIIKG